LFSWQLETEQLDPRGYAERRVEGRVYLTKSFQLEFSTSRDFGQMARYAIRVFDTQPAGEPASEWEWTEMEIYRSPQGRVQIRAMVAREAGAVRQIKFEKVGRRSLDTLFTLDRDRAQGLIDFIRALEYVDPDGGEAGGRVDEQTMRDLFRDPSALNTLYTREPEHFRELIRKDTAAEDLIALARRREVVETFRTWLEDTDVFAAAAAAAGGPEHAWQRLFEANPWILGVGLGGQLLTSWSNTRLEQVVSGFSIAGAGKRVDALLKTQGPISNLVLAEVKPHTDELLGPEYRPGCWSPSRGLAGAVVQTQQTAYRAAADLEERLTDQGADGSDLSTSTYVIRPKSYLVIGRLAELLGDEGGVHRDKLRSFEVFRRSLTDPQIITFDELLARAEWQVQHLEAQD
jgi:hypothetical protein